MKSLSVEKLVIGSRGSPLALAQTKLVAEALRTNFPEIKIKIKIIKTTGDTVRDRPLSHLGGKGLFTREIEEALLQSRIDIAVHSAKDMETHLPAGLTLAAVLPREDPRDALLSAKAEPISNLPVGSVLGTTSPRRRAQILYSFPNLKVVSIRGNVETRIRKLRDGEVDAILLAVAGLKRLRLFSRNIKILEPEEMLPSAAQGTIGIESREEDGVVADLLASINHIETMQMTMAERALLGALGGSCHTPIGALAESLPNGQIGLKAMIADPNGAWVYRIKNNSKAANAVILGKKMGEELRTQVLQGHGDSIFDE